MKYIIEVALLALVWFFGNQAIDHYFRLGALQTQLQLKTQLNRFATELSLETMSAIDQNVYHFDKHAQKQLEYKRIARQLNEQGFISDSMNQQMAQFEIAVDTYMQLASMLKTSFRYVAKQSVNSHNIYSTYGKTFDHSAALVSNLQVTNSASTINAVTAQLNEQLKELERIEKQMPKVRVMRLHIEFIIANASDASSLLQPIRENSLSRTILQEIQSLNQSIDEEYWHVTKYILLSLVLIFALVIVAMLRLMLELKRANQAATQASETKSMFLSNMSHEIRTPMNGIVGLTDILLLTSLSVTQRNYLEKIRFSANALTTIINDILDFSKIESKKLHIERANFQFEELLDNVRSLISPLANSKGIKLVFDIDPQLKTFYLGDSVRIGQILLNLMSNAVKFTQNGSVTLKITTIPHINDPDFEWLEISVIDTGIGIDSSRITQLFDRFTQGESSTTRKYGGTGLGLTICKLLTELMGGEITVESEYAKGSAFTVKLPLQVGEDDSHKGTIKEQGSILIVEDDPIYMEISTSIANSIGYKVTGALSGACAKELLAAKSFDVLLLDWVLPDCEADRLLEDLRGASRLPNQVVIYTAHPDTLINHYVDYPVLSKPLLKKDLMDALNGTLHQDEHGKVASQTVQEDLNGPRPNKCKVLLVEDNEINRIVALKMLNDLGVEVTTVVNGREAVDTVIEHKGSFDLVLMDIQMPIMDGVEATKAIRQIYSPESLNIIALTANVMETEIDKYTVAGMNGHLGKPFKMSALENLLNRCTNWR